jgi:hypothetical protein
MGTADVVIPAALRVGGGVAGAALGGLLTAPTGPGAIAGASGGGLVGSAAGDALAQGYEMLRGNRDDYNLAQTAIEGAVGAVPVIGKTGKLGATMLRRGVQGAALNTAADVAQQTLAEGRGLAEVDVPRVAGAAALGGVLGAGGGAVETRLANRRVATPAVAAAADDVTPSAPRQAAPDLPKVSVDAPPPVAAPPVDLPPVDVDPVRTPRTPPTPEAVRLARVANQDGLPPTLPIPEERRVMESMAARFPEESRKDLLDIIERNNAFEYQRRGVQTNERTKALAQHLSMDVTQKLRPGTILNAEETQYLANALVGVNSQIDDLAKKIAEDASRGITNDWDKLSLATARNDQATMLASFLGTRAEQGRALQSHRIMAELMRSGDLNALRKMLQVHPTLKDIDGFAEAFLAKGTDIEKMDFARDTLSKQMTLGDKALAVYYANILSGVKTHLRNLFGSGANIAFREVAQGPAVAFDVARSKITGAPRTIYAGEINHRAAGAWQGVQKGLHDAAFVLKHGYSPENVTMFDAPRVELAGGAKNPFNLPGRMLEAEDALMYRTVYEANLSGRLYAKAREAATKAGVTGAEADTLVGRYMADNLLNPPKDVAEGAAKAAQQALFREEPGQFVQWILQKKDAGPMGKALSFVLPFVRVPGNIFRQTMENNVVTGLLPAQARQTLRAGGREAAELVGRMTTGTAALGLLATWVAQGRVSGGGPTDPNQRAALMETGWKPYSVQVPGVGWVDFNLIAQPIAMPLAMLANAWETHQRDDEASLDDVAIRGVMSLGSTMLDQSFLSGVSDFNAAMTRPEQFAKNWAARTAQGFVPMSGLSRNLAQTVDSTLRDTSDPSLVKQTAKGIQSIVPGASAALPPRLDRFGRPVERTGGRAAGMLPLTADEGPKDDPVLNGLSALGVTSIGLPPKAIGREGSRTAARVELTVEERQQVGQATYKALEQLFRTSLPALQRMEPTAAESRVRRVVDDARARVYQEIRRSRRR